MSPTIPDAIEALYRAFDPCALPDEFESCPCCVDTRVMARLRGELRNLDIEDVDHYAFKAVTTWGGAETFRYFAPRIVELAISPDGDAYPGLDLPQLTKKFELAGWRRWPDDQRAAVRNVFMAAAMQGLSDMSVDFSARLCAAAAMCDTIQPLLAAWEAADAPLAVYRLADVVIDQARVIGRLGRPWRDYQPAPRAAATFAANSATFADWLARDATRERLEQAFMKWMDDPWATLFAEAEREHGWM